MYLQVKDTLQKALTSLVDLARTRDYLKPATALNKGDNNRLSRSAAVGAGPSISLVDLCMNKRTKQDNASIRLLHQGMFSCVCMCVFFSVCVLFHLNFI